MYSDILVKIEERNYPEALALLEEVVANLGHPMFEILKKLIAARVYLDDGNLIGALEIGENVVKTPEILDHSRLILEGINIMGLAYWRLGERKNVDQMILHGRRVIDELASKERSLVVLAEAELDNLEGLNCWRKGLLESSAIHHKRALETREKHQLEVGIAVSLNNLGATYIRQGKLLNALELITKSLFIWQKRQNSRLMGYSYKNLGIIYFGLRNYPLAEENMLQAVNLWKGIGANLDLTDVLFELIRLNISYHKLDQAESFFSDLEDLNQSNSNKLIKLRVNLARGLLLKSKNRILYVAQSQEIFQNILDEDIIDFSLTAITFRAQCEILIYELELFRDKGILTDVENLTNQYYEVSNYQGSFTHLVEALILKSKIKFIVMNPEESFELLEQAEKICLENNLIQLVEKTRRELSFFKSKLVGKTTQSMLNVDIRDRIREIKILEYLSDVKDVLKSKE